MVAALLVVVWPVITGQTTTNNAFADQGELLDFRIGGLVVSLAGIRKWFKFVTNDLTFVTAVVTFRLLGLEGYIQCANLLLQEMHKLIHVFQICNPIFH